MFTQKQSHSQIAHHKPVFCLFGRGAHFAHRLARPLVPVVLSFCVLPTLPGCGWGKSTKRDEPNPYADQAPGVFDDDRALDIPDTQDDSIQWSIILVTLPNMQLAQQALVNVQSKHGLLSAYTKKRQGKAVIAYGRYEGPNDQRALIDLDRVREIQSTNGTRPFAAAFLAPPSSETLGGQNAEYNLRTVKSRFGPKAIYTLQIGVYGTHGGESPSASEIKEFRTTAERAVLELRDQGEQAFYYHAPLRSMVTIGVFGEQDFDGTTTPAIESMRLKELRKRYPHNYLNGQGIRETIRSSTGQRITRLQPSNLVSIPEK